MRDIIGLIVLILGIIFGFVFFFTVAIPTLKMGFVGFIGFLFLSFISGVILTGSAYLGGQVMKGQKM